jgi:type I restriction enzyme, R subunit
MAMIHKFREADLKETFLELNASSYILVMTDVAWAILVKRRFPGRTRCEDFLHFQ